MTYKVIWGSRAKASLANIWLQASDKAAVNSAVGQIDRFLTSLQIENITGYRIAIAKPLAVTYRVSESKRTIRVLDVWIR
jgi:hypothetical protein